MKGIIIERSFIKVVTSSLCVLSLHLIQLNLLKYRKKTFEALKG